MLLWPFNKYPGTDYETFNWDWLIGLGKKMEKALHDLFSDTGALHQMVDKVLGEHPEWTTTVMDGAISTAKLADGAVTKNKMASYSDFIPVREFSAYYQNNNNTGTHVYWYRVGADYKPDLSLAGDNVNMLKQPGEIVKSSKATLAINAGLYDTSPAGARGCVIDNGVIMKGSAIVNANGFADILYMTSDGKLHAMDQANSAQDVLDAGAVWAVQGWYAVINNGVLRTDSYWNSIDKRPMSFIAQDADGVTLVGACDGRSITDEGFDISDLYDFVINTANFTPVILYLLDGGGSTALIYQGARVNELIQGELRTINNMIIFKSDQVVNNDALTSTVNEDMQRLDDMHDLYKSITPELLVYQVDVAQNYDANDMRSRGCWHFQGNNVAAEVDNLPVAKAGTLTVQLVEGSDYYVQQWYQAFDSVTPYVRRWLPGSATWTEWTRLIDTADGRNYEYLMPGIPMTANTDLNSALYTTPGTYAAIASVSSTLANNPDIYHAFVLKVFCSNGNWNTNGNWNYCTREISYQGNTAIYRQTCSSNGSGVWSFSSWYKIEGTAV